MYVLDATAFIESYEPAGPTATVPEVREELEDATAYRFDAMEGSGMHIQLPGEPAVERVKQTARETGDAEALSATDVRLVAAAIELDATLVTDDYAMQNVAEALGLDVDAIAREGIEERRDWLFQCSGCGREFDDHHDRCPVCGSELSRKNPP
ncbi:MAG: NOB1 family endonuclease [Halobacteriaceae archaeon]